MKKIKSAEEEYYDVKRETKDFDCPRCNYNGVYLIETDVTECELLKVSYTYENEILSAAPAISYFEFDCPECDLTYRLAFLGKTIVREFKFLNIGTPNQI